MFQDKYKLTRWFLVTVVLYATILAYHFSGAFDEPYDYNKLGTDGIFAVCAVQWSLSNLNGTANFAITEAPIFFPCPHARFYGDHYFGHLVFTWPLSLFIKSPVSLLAAAYMLNLFTTGIATYLLCLWLTSSPLAALISGVFFMIGNNFIQFEFTSFGWGIFAIFFFMRHFKSKRWDDVIGMVVGGILAGLGNIYICLYTSVTIFILFVTRLIYSRSPPSRRWFLQIAVAAVIIAVALSPVMLMYKKVQDEFGFRRKDFLTTDFVPFFSKDARSQPAVATITPINCAQILLILCGLFIFFRRKNYFLDWQYSFFALTLLCFWMAFFQNSPYRILFLLPGFNGIRAAGSWKLFFAFGLTVLSAMLMAYFLKKKSLIIRNILLIASFLLIFYSLVGEMKNSFFIRRFKSRWLSFPMSVAVYDHLRTQPYGAVLNLPLSKNRVHNEVISCVRMMYQLSHKKPMVMGYSSFMPPLTRKIYAHISTNDISDAIIEKLVITGVRYIAVDYICGNSSEVCNKLRVLAGVKILYENKDGMLVELPKVKVEKDMSKLLNMWD